jgi:transcriptional regulator with XRE-family HTH domain
VRKFKEIGDRLRTLREPITQPDFANSIGVSLTAYQNYESGKRIPRGDVLRKIASKYQTTVDWILYGQQHEPTMKEALAFVRHSLTLEKMAYTEDDVERLAVNYLRDIKEKKHTSIAAETTAPYLDAETKKIIDMLKDMDKEGRRDVLKYTEEKKQAAAWRRGKELKGG